MKDNIHQVWAAGTRTEECRIQHVGDPCEWMPIRFMKSERPGGSIARYPLQHDRVLRYVSIVIDSNKIVGCCRPKSENNCEEKERQDYPGSSRPQHRPFRITCSNSWLHCAVPGYGETPAD